ncbi:MAG TPA: hypothetical protein DD639_04395, partial [Acinetobacter sp.]|nr:hypothetical protein [Acinetobacter sp.]
AYNAEIDAITETQIQRHNLSLQLLEQLKGRLNLDIKIENQGTLLASNVNVEIKIPDFITVINENDDEYNIEYFEKNILKNLIKIETPEQRSENSKYTIHDHTSILGHRGINFNKLTTNPVKSSIKNNIIYITLDSLLHSKHEIFHNFYIFPNERGNGVIKVQLICAEYSHIETFEIPITAE